MAHVFLEAMVRRTTMAQAMRREQEEVGSSKSSYTPKVDCLPLLKNGNCLREPGEFSCDATICPGSTENHSSYLKLLRGQFGFSLASAVVGSPGKLRISSFVRAKSV